MDFKAPQELWNPLSKTNNEFHDESGRHSIHKICICHFAKIFVTDSIYNDNRQCSHWWQFIELTFLLQCIESKLVSTNTRKQQIHNAIILCIIMKLTDQNVSVKLLSPICKIYYIWFSNKWRATRHSVNNSCEPHRNYHTALLIYSDCACLSGHWVATLVFALITPHITSKDEWRKPKEKRFPTLSIFVIQIPFKFKACMDFFIDFQFGCVLQMLFWKLI